MSKTKQRHPRSSHVASPQPPQGSGFANGLLFGAVLGAAGYFLLGTKEGRKIKDQLVAATKQGLTELDAQRKALPENTKKAKKEIDKTVKETKKKAKKTKKQADKKVKEAKSLAKRVDKQIKKTSKTFTKKANKVQKKFFRNAAK